MANLGYIQLNRTCNQKCLFCSNPENGNVLSYKKAVYYIDDLLKNNFSGVIFTGGEPTLNKNLIKLLQYCLQKNLESRIITNGQKTADFGYLKSLKDSGLKLMHISVQTIDPQRQDYLSQNKDSLKNILKTLLNARKLGIQVNLNTVIHSYNAKSLDKNVKFFVMKFPEIQHYVFNNLDPRMNRVSKHKFLVPKLVDFKNSLSAALSYLKKHGKSFRVERVPLCYMSGFEEFSTETRKIVKNEERRILFLDDRKNPYSKQDNFFYQKAKQCQQCSLAEICAGLYALGDYFSADELIPQTKPAESIINRIQGHE
jgi:MoaA/NifB/PqqE/SkfB family radical SAM enzyme